MAFQVAQGRRDLIKAANEIGCAICGEKPCYLLSTAAAVVLKQALVLDDNLVGGVNYVRHLRKLHDCVLRHQAAAHEAYGLDISPSATEQIESTIEEFIQLDKGVIIGKSEILERRTLMNEASDDEQKDGGRPT